MDVAKQIVEIEEPLWPTHLEVRRLLAVLLCQPERDTFIQEAVIPRLLTAFKDLLPEGAESLDSCLAALDEEGQETLLTEYTRLFIGPDTLPAPLYGSIYLDSGRQIFGESTEAVQQQYIEEGLVVSDGVHEPPDHISLEFEFVVFLLEKAAAARSNGSEEEASKLLEKANYFESTFIRSWVPQLANAIQQAANTRFYQGVADFLLAYSKVEAPRMDTSSGGEVEPGS